MAAPEYVPRPKDEKARVYESPPWLDESWMADRPAELENGQPDGPMLGTPGPDQGYVLKLARTFEGKLALTAGETEDDALSGACAVALRRAAVFGRAPVIHDLTIALRVYGFLTDGTPDPELVRFRKGLFEGVSHLHHYSDRRGVADAVPDAVLRLTPQEVQARAGRDWRSLFSDAGPAASPAPTAGSGSSPAH